MFPVQPQAPTHKEGVQGQIQQNQPTTPRKSPVSVNAAQKTKETAAVMVISDRHSDYPPNAPGTSTKFSHLPTPQSPNNFAHYLPGGLPNTPESPSVHGSYSSLLKSSPTERSVPQNLMELSTPKSQQIMTPESSPFVHRTLSSPSKDATPTSHSNVNASFETMTRATSWVPIEPPANVVAPHRTPSPSPTHSSCLSSPFVAKTSIPTKSTPRTHSNSPNSLQATNNENLFATHSRTTRNSSTPSMSTLISTPPISPVSSAVTAILPSSNSPTLPVMPTAAAGGEMNRIRQAIQAEQDALENRRPDYLKRTKRTLSEADPSAFVEDDKNRDAHRFGTVGIAESPAKGRRIALFQETSEESFEESLMAGGYGRYRTADWVRQPQPIALPTPGAAGASNVIARLEEAQPEEVHPPTEKELKKQKRLAAFRSDNGASSSKLYPVELEGKGRVLLDVPNDQAGDEFDVVGGKRRALGGKRKKKAELTAKEKRALAAAAAAEDSLMKPNWPDSEFPWRLRTEERAEQAKAEEEERLKWIERFLDRDTDEDDDGETGSAGPAAHEEDDDVIPSTQWGVVYDIDDEPPRPFRGGRGKMVPLSGDPEDDEPRVRRSAFFPSDPADARAALLSKRSVRALSYRQYRKQRKEDVEENDEELLCICRGRDDGRELVQCDSCKKWYHLECIGITNIAELGREEDPWYCHRCDTDMDDVESGPKPNPVPIREPTFAPTEPRLIRPAADRALYSSPSLEDSPSVAWSSSPSRALQTPTRGPVGNRDTEFSSGSTAYTTVSSRGYPTTPRPHPGHGRVFAQITPSAGDGYDESSFDPSSTPSRGIKFGAQFTTPKNMFSSRSFQTPSRPTLRGPPGSAFGAPGFLSSALDDKGNDYSPYGRVHGYDDSPIRRARSTEGHKARRIFEPSASSRDLDSDLY